MANDEMFPGSGYDPKLSPGGSEATATAVTRVALGLDPPEFADMDPNAPPWESGTWLSADTIYKQNDRQQEYFDSAIAAHGRGDMSDSDLEYIKSAMHPEGEVSRLGRMLFYKEDGGTLRDVFSIVETFSSYRFFLSLSSAATKGVLANDPDDGIFSKVGFSTEEFKRAWGSRDFYKDVFNRHGADVPGGAAGGLGLDVLMDPVTWLTFGLGAASKIGLTKGSKAATVLNKNISRSAGFSKVESGAQLTLTPYGNDIIKMASDDFIEGAIPEIYAKYNVPKGQLMPEHLARFMGDDASARILDIAVDSFEKYATRHLNGISGVSSDGIKLAKATWRHSIGGLKTSSSKINMLSGPRSMFVETAGFLNKPRGFYGDNLLGSLAQAEKAVGQQLDGFAAELATRDVTPEALLFATQVGSTLAEKSYSATSAVRNFFTSAVERMPLEKRAKVSLFKTASDYEMSLKAAHIRDTFSTPIRRIDPITGEEYLYDLAKDRSARQLISKHMESPEIHPLPDHLLQFKTWAKNEFKEIQELEKKWGVAGETLEDYVTHIYSSKAAAKLMENVKAQAARSSGTPIDDAFSPTYIKNKNTFAFHRTIATLDDAEKWVGKGNVETDIANIIFRRWQVARNVVSKQQIQSFMITDSGIGGLADSFIFQGRAFRQMFRGLNYRNSYVTLGDGGKARAGVKAEIFSLVDDASKIDLRLLSRRNKETLDGALERAGTGGIKRTVPGAVTTGDVVKEVVMKDGKWIQVTSRGGKVHSKDIIPWFRGMGDTKTVAKKKLQNTVKYNREKLNQITNKVFDGKNLSDLTQGEAEMLRDMLSTVVGSRVAGKGSKLVAPGWIGADNLVVVNFFNDGVSSIVQPLRYFSKEVDEAGGRLAPSGMDTMNVADEDISRIARDLLKRRGVEPEGVDIRPTQYTDEQVANVANELRHGKDIPAHKTREEAEALLKRFGVSPEAGKEYSGKQISDAVEHLISPRVKKVSADKSSIFELEMSAARQAVKESEVELKFLSNQREVLRKTIDTAGGEKKYETVWNKIADYEANLKDAMTLLRKELKIKAGKKGKQRVAWKRLDKAANRANNARAKLYDSYEQLDELFKKQGLETMSDQIKKMRARKSTAEVYGAKAKARQMRVGTDISGQYVLPESMVKAVGELTGHHFAEVPAGKLLKAWQKYQRVYKIGLTLPFSEHHFRNSLTNVGLTATVLGIRMLKPANWKPVFSVIGRQLAMMHGSQFPTLSKMVPPGARKKLKEHFDNIAEEWGNEVHTDVLGRKYTTKQIGEEAVKRGLNNSFVHAELGYTPFAMFDNAHHGVLTPASKAARKIHTATVGMTAHGEMVTDVPFRITMFTDQVLQGKSFDEAAEVVKAYLNDWGRLSRGEQTAARTLIPFYSWLQFSLERGFKDMFLHPDKFVGPNKLFQNITADEPSIGGYNWLADKLGIAEEPNEYGYIRKLTGFGINQEEAIRHWVAAKDLSVHFLGSVLGAQDTAKFLSPETGGIITPERAPYRFLAQSDFILKAAVELATNRELFSGAPISGDALAVGRSRLESGYAFSRLDDPEGVLENVLTVGGKGGKWLKSWLEYKEDPNDPRRAVVNSKKRWFLGQLPTARVLSTYEKHVRSYRPGEVNYRKTALSMMGIHAYWYHPGERKYYLDRSRVRYAARLLRKAHIIESGMVYTDPVLSKDTGIEGIVAGIKRSMDVIETSDAPKTESAYTQLDKEN